MRSRRDSADTGSPKCKMTLRSLPEVLGVVPAAGRATRLSGLAGSKEVVALGVDSEGRKRPVTGFLLERFRRAGIESAVVVLRSGKWDVAETLGNGSRWGVDLGYRIVDETPSVPHTLDTAYPMLRGKVVALGFPDIVFEPADAFATCLDRLLGGNASIVLGLFPSDQPEKTDMVELDASGRPVAFSIKSADRGLRFTWSIAVWLPEVTERLHQWMTEDKQSAGPSDSELYVGNFFSWALERGVAIEAELFEDGSYLDVGTREDLERARSQSRTTS